MKEHKVVAFQRPDAVEDPLTELLRRGAHDLIARAVETEMAVFMTQFAGLQDGAGRQAVVRNGYQPGREILTGLEPVSVRIPKVRSRTETPTGNPNLDLHRRVSPSPQQFSWGSCRFYC